MNDITSRGSLLPVRVAAHATDLRSTPTEDLRAPSGDAPAPLGEHTPGPAKDSSTIETSLPGEQASNAALLGARPAARVQLVIGPVGAGKSTFAERLARERSAVRLTLDEWMVTLFRPDRPEAGLVSWYRERAQRCIEQIWKVCLLLTARGDDVVLEIGLLRREERERFYERVSEQGLPLTIHVLDAARDVRRARVLQRNRDRGPTYSMDVPPEIFELASDLWQAPDSDECEGRDVRFLFTDANGAAG
jgi:predicted kinase